MSKSPLVPITDIILNDANPRGIEQDKFDQLQKSLLMFPKMLHLRPVVVDEANIVLGGNMRLRALIAISQMRPAEINIMLGKCNGYAQKTELERENLRKYWEKWLMAPVVEILHASQLSEEEKREFIIKDNLSYGNWDWDMLANEWEPMELEEWGLDCWQPDNEGEAEGNGSAGSSSESGKHGSLSDKFIAPPFTILDTRQGYWRQRKAMWRERIADFGESREGTLADGETNCMASINNGVSLLDPVMAEIVCRWFGVEGGTAFDCFAGDTVFGYVAATLGMSFTGIELREEQARLNNERVEGMNARYICDDGQMWPSTLRLAHRICSLAALRTTTLRFTATSPMMQATSLPMRHFWAYLKMPLPMPLPASRITALQWLWWAIYATRRVTITTLWAI